MEPFAIYIIICLYSSGKCIDYGGWKSWVFRSQAECTVVADKIFDIKRRELKLKGELYIDGISFCLMVAGKEKA